MRFLYPPAVNFNFMRQRPQKLMEMFARAGHPAYYINTEASIPGTKVYPGVYQFYPDIPLYIYPKDTKYTNLEYDVLYYSYPPVGIQTLRRKKTPFVLFDSVDEPTSGVFQFWNQGNAYYESLERADLVLATAHSLYETAKKYNDNVLLSPNACDYEFFNISQEKPMEYRNENRPIVIYSGAIASWVDLELLKRTAQYNSQFAFFAIGAEFNDRMGQTPQNLRFLGYKDYTEVPAYLQWANLGIIPFKPGNPEVQACNPIKMTEYLACGLPVVTTKMEECRNVVDVVISKDSREFIANIPKAIHADKGLRGVKNMKIRQEYAKENSWENRAKEIIDKIHEMR